MRKGRIKNIILKSLAAVAVVAFVTSASVIEQTFSPVAMLAAALSLGYVALFAKANNYFEGEYDD